LLVICQVASARRHRNDFLTIFEPIWHLFAKLYISSNVEEFRQVLCPTSQ